MNPQDQSPKPTNSLEELDMDSTSSVDDFIRQLEAKEKDLHITADMSIEIADSDFDMGGVPDFMQPELLIPPVAKSPVAKSFDSQASPATKARNYELENELSSLKVKVLELRNERNEIQEKSDRRIKDFENFKYRMDRERRGSFIDQIANLASQMLPVLDNLDRALDMVPASAEKKTPEFQQMFDGIVLVNQQLNEVFAGMGVTSISCVGETFDPNFHEAVATDELSDLPPNTVSGEMLRGYRIGNKVIRHSMVKVATAPLSVNTPSHVKPVESVVETAFEATEENPDSQEASSTEAE